MLLRVLVTSLLALVISTLTVVTPTATGASRHPRDLDASGRSHGKRDPGARRTLERPAETVVAYWRGNPHADVRLAFSPDGTKFGPAEDAGRDEIGRARKDGTTYGALHSANGAVAVRVTTDRPVERLTVLGLSDGSTTQSTRRPSSAGLLSAARRPRRSRRSSRGAPGVRIRRT